MKTEKVGFISRLDLGPGFRRGLLEQARLVFEHEGVDFVVIAGGLVSLPHLRKQLTGAALDEMWFTAGEADLSPKERRAEARETLLDGWAAELAEAIPQIKVGGRTIKIYIITSPAPNYDGWLGTEIARRLVDRNKSYYRPDILFWGERTARFPLKQGKRTIQVLVPQKAAWRGDYASTPVDRLIKDERRQASHEPPDLWVVGCTASSLHVPEGEHPEPYISLPALHRLQEVHTSENQLGVTVVEFLPDNVLVRTYNLKDLIAREREWLPDPEEAPNLQRRVIATLKERGPMTIGMLEDTMRVARDRISAAIQTLNEGGYQPTVILNPDSQLYDFDAKWIQRELMYPPTAWGGLAENIILAFGCLHAGSVYTQYEWFLRELPRVMLERGATTLVGAGDFIQGLKHNLGLSGESIGGFSYTQQEKLAARLVAAVITKVFEARFTKAFEASGNIEEAIKTSLVKFLYIEGNHEDWEREVGVTPLVTFRAVLIEELEQAVEKALARVGKELPLSTMRQIMEEKVVYGEGPEPLPSGPTVALKHPHMGRAQTTSLRLQHALGAAEGRVVVVANFHVAVAAGQWEPGIGQRIGLQVGTILLKSGFEAGKLKTVDTGAAHLRVLSDGSGRIVMSEVAFYRPKKAGEERGNDKLFELFAQSLGI